MKPILIRYVFSVFLLSQATADEPARAWSDLMKSVDPASAAVAGNWRKNHSELSTNAVRSSRITLPFQPKSEYDFRVEFTRTSGVHSIALMFVAPNGQATFEVDAWGQHLAGLQMIDGQSIQTNRTRSEGHTLINGRRYTAMVQVRKDRIRAYLDDRMVADHPTTGSRLSVPAVWRMPDTASLGIGAYEAAATFHKIEVRPVGGSADFAGTNKPTSTKRPQATNNGPSMRRKGRSTQSTSGKRVLLVIANRDFFYREYAEPRRELERAGINVDVAAGRKEVCTPHSNSGQQGNGNVMPDLALADADASRYDAVMFSGGWGSSMYQYAFRGSYGNRTYNGDRRTKDAVNKLLGDFVKQDKYVGGLCHGVSVLAWARIDGNSLLHGRRAVASPRQSPSGVYNGRQGQPLSRWNAEVNGALLSPARSIGDPRTSEDDVLVDGRIITGEDDNSARLFGATLARLLTNSSQPTNGN